AFVDVVAARPIGVQLEAVLAPARHATVPIRAGLRAAGRVTRRAGVRRKGHGVRAVAPARDDRQHSDERSPNTHPSDDAAEWGRISTLFVDYSVHDRLEAKPLRRLAPVAPAQVPHPQPSCCSRGEGAAPGGVDLTKIARAETLGGE